MLEFWQNIFSGDVSFLRYALIAGILASLPFGMMGSLVVSRRITALAGAISHAVLGGVGMALYLNRVHQWSFLTPFAGAVFAALLAAIAVGIISIYAKEREDTVIGIVWALGMSIGLLFIGATPGYVDLQGYLFGNILLLSKTEVYWTLGLNIIVLLPLGLFYNHFLAMSFDGTFAEIRGIKVRLLYLLMLILVALTIVMMVNLVGIVLVIALLTLPAATAGCFTRHLWSMMVFSALWCMILTVGGLTLSYSWNVSSGPLIVILAVVFYLAALAVRKVRNRR